MKRKMVTTILATVLSVAMVVPAFAATPVADDVVIEESIVEEVAIEDEEVLDIIDDETALEESIADEEVLEEVIEEDVLDTDVEESVEEVVEEDTDATSFMPIAGSVTEDENGTVYFNSEDASIVAEDGAFALPGDDSATEDGVYADEDGLAKIDDEVFASVSTIQLGGLYQAKFVYGGGDFITAKFVVPTDGVITYISTRPVNYRGQQHYIDEYILDAYKNCIRGVNFNYQLGQYPSEKYYISRIGLKKGTYHLAIKNSVYGGSGKVEKINFGLAYTPGTYYEKESNDSNAGANKMSLNHYYKGFLGDSYSAYYNNKNYADEYDYYKVSLVADQIYKVCVPDLEKYYNTTTICEMRTPDSSDKSLSLWDGSYWRTGDYKAYLCYSSGLYKDENGTYFYYVKPLKTQTYYIDFYNYSKIQYSYRVGVYDYEATVPSPTEKMYNIKFAGNGATSGSMANMYDIPYSSSVKLVKNQYKRKGYTFKGWNTKKDGSGKSYANAATVKKLTSTDGKTITLYAQWTPIKYNIKFNANGGKGSMSTIKSIKYGSKKKLPGNKYTKKGYKFLGWNTNKKAKTAKYKNKAEIKNLTTTNGKTITLYAIWKKK